MGGTIVKLGLIQDGILTQFSQFEANRRGGLRHSLPIIMNHVQEMMTDSNVRVSDLDGVGLSFPCIVDNQEKCVLATNEKYIDAEDFDLAAWAEDEFGCHFEIDNDARMALMGEWIYGAGKGSDDLVMMTIGTGIGGAAMMNGRLVRGKHHQAGCLGGHFIVQSGGRKCSCGGQGCVEAEASTWQLPNLMSADPRFEKESADDDPMSFRVLFGEAEKGDDLHKDIRDHCMSIWAAGVVNMVHAYDPEIVIIGGGVMRSGKVILPFLQKEVERLAWTPWGQPEVVSAHLGDHAALLGSHYIISQSVAL